MPGPQPSKQSLWPVAKVRISGRGPTIQDLCFQLKINAFLFAQLGSYRLGSYRRHTGAPPAQTVGFGGGHSAML